MRKLLSLALLLVSGCYSYAQTPFEDRIAELGFSEIVTDWSDSTDINIPRPKCAYVNLTGISELPKINKPANGWLEAYDGNGNYFKKRIVIDGQGKSSSLWAKTNFKVDFCEDEWLADATTDITIGNWVEQDSYHFKAFYLDYFKGTGIIGYMAYDAMTNDRGTYGRIWERAVEHINKPDPKARCFPDAFPCVVYLNGEFYGLYCWQLKKHRKNMNMKKNNLEHIHLDGSLGNKTLFRGTIKWESVEVRNPKNLYNMYGNPYDGSQHSELIDETSPYFNLETDDDKTREGKQNTALVKATVQKLSNYYSELMSLKNGGASDEEMKAAIEERFDVTSLCDYIIHNLLTNNMDGIERNFQFFTYDGQKWFIAPYDLDGTFGYHPVVPRIFPPTNYGMGPLSSRTFSKYDPMSWAYNYYLNDIHERYAEIRNSGALTAENIISMFETWYYAFGEDNYRMEYERWPSAPPILDDLANDGWEIYPNSYTYKFYSSKPEYSADTEYHEGDICSAKYRLWRATSTVKGVLPYKQIGCKDSLERISSWVKIHLETLDSYMKFKFTSQIKSYTLEVSNAGWSTLCLPFSFAIPVDMQVYTVKGRSAEGRLVLEHVDAPEANKPYLVKAAPGAYLLTGYTEEASEYADDYLVNGLLHGCYAARYVPAGNYVLQNHNGATGFYRVEKDGTTKMGPNRAYLASEGDDGGVNEYVVDTPDGITTFHNADDDNNIIGIYDAGGVKWDGLHKGVNLVRYSNGKTKKMVIK